MPTHYCTVIAPLLALYLLVFPKGFNSPNSVNATATLDIKLKLFTFTSLTVSQIASVIGCVMPKITWCVVVIVAEAERKAKINPVKHDEAFAWSMVNVNNQATCR